MRLTKIFNLNDPGWGRGNPSGSGQSEQNNRPSQGLQDPSARPQDSSSPPKGEGLRPPQGDNPPDLDRVFEDFAKRLKSVFGDGSGGGNRRPPNNNNGRSPKRPVVPSPKLFRLGVIAAVVIGAGVWASSGFYIVREGQVGVVTQFGKYYRTVGPGFQWHIPSPIQSVQTVDVSRVRSFSVGYRDNARNKVLPESLMLTEDENIVDVQFDVQYRLKAGMPTEPTQRSAAADYLFETVSPDEAVRQAAETAMREVVGKQSMNKILYESRTQAAIDVRQLMQNILDRYHTGIEVITVAIQNVQPPEQVQAAFEDAIKAGQDNERQKNEGNAYASKVVPEARGHASRLIQDAEGYKAAVVGQAQGEADRFLSVEKAYAQAPAITRERMYISTMEELYSASSKVLLDTKSGNNMIYLPIDKIIGSQSKAVAAPVATESAGNATATTAPKSASSMAYREVAPSYGPSELTRDRNAFSRMRPAE
ncbi:FtsH protease activity modulator HflK [Pelistega europaea]|uniref:Protein HflK n=1 Tax=Pelistega europaea TaxID=106147 RepID=A0A7Y4P6C1_9BURK|nr:FtsH protease activity modulator HflK [Pelistega europaea]NOL49605.1 FtsH protease activity modulator HflK [Pelistega europaea]